MSNTQPFSLSYHATQCAQTVRHSLQRKSPVRCTCYVPQAGVRESYSKPPLPQAAAAGRGDQFEMPGVGFGPRDSVTMYQGTRNLGARST